jgi:hypothetical protein
MKAVKFVFSPSLTVAIAAFFVAATVGVCATQLHAEVSGFAPQACSLKICQDDQECDGSCACQTDDPLTDPARCSIILAEANR